MGYQVHGYTPEQGDIVRLDLNPTKGREMQKNRRVIVVSRTAYNKRTGFIVVCPITSTKRRGYIPIPKEYDTYGYIDFIQLRSIDFIAPNRKVRFIEKTKLETLGQVAQRIESIFGFNELF